MPGSGATKGGLVVISGPSGTGKTTICKRLARMDPNIEFSVSATTRPSRPGEVDGKDYHFLTREEFASRIQRGELVEHAEYAGELYGTLKEPLERAVAAGRTMILDIDTQGAEQVLAAYPDAVTIFLEPPSFEELLRRLHGRNTDSPDKQQRRIQIARREMARRMDYRHRVVNDNLDKAVCQVYSIITGTRR